MKNISSHRYEWQAGSPVVCIDCDPTPDGRYQVRITAAASDKPADLSKLPSQLHTHGFPFAYADAVSGQNVLVVPHVKKPEQLVEFLAAGGYLAGTARHEMHEVKQSKRHFDTLKWSGRVGLVGHGALAVGGMLKGEWGQVAAAPLGASTAAILSYYGNGKEHIDFDGMLAHMNDYFAAEGLPLPSLNAPEHKKTILGKIDQVLGKYPLPIGYTVGSAGAIGLMQTGIKRYQETRHLPKPSGLSLFAAGTSSLIGNLAVLFVPERKKTKAERAEEKKRTWGEWIRSLPATWANLLRHPTQIPKAAYDFVAESPLRFNGSLNFVDNIFYFFNAASLGSMMQDWRKNHKDLIEDLEKELHDLRIMPPDMRTEEMETRIAKLIGKNGEIAVKNREWDLAKSIRGKFIPYLALTTALSFGCATLLSAISSKNRNESESAESAYDRLYALVAKLVIAMPQEKRGDMLNRIGDYLSAQEDVRDGEVTSDKLVAEVKKRVAVMEKSPFLAVGERASKLAPAPQAAGAGIA